MNKHASRGLTLVALTAGFTLFGTSAANAIDIGGGDDNGGLLGGLGLNLGGDSSGDGLLDDLLNVDLGVPVNVDGLNVNVLGGNGSGGLLGGSGDSLLGDTGLIGATTGSTNADILSGLGIDTSDLLGNDDLAAVVGVPLDVSNTWISVLGNEPNGIVVVPNVSGGPTAVITDGVDGLLNAVVDVPVDVSCTSVTVLSDYENECAGTPADTDGDSDGGLLGGDLLGGDLLGGDILGGGDGGLLGGDILGGDILGGGDGGLLGDDGIELDLGDTVLTPTVDAGHGDDSGLGDVVGALVSAPIDLSDVWVSAFGDDGGIVIIPDLTIDASVLTGGLISSEILAPITLDCVTITVLSDFQRDCGTSVIDGEPDPETPIEEPVDPTDPTTPVVPGDGNGGDTGADNDALDPCAVEPTSALTGMDTGAGNSSLTMLGLGALAGALLAAGLLVLGRKASAL
jgi:hypothetical protein